jgi:hypothetical protein
MDLGSSYGAESASVAYALLTLLVWTVDMTSGAFLLRRFLRRYV